MVRAYLCEVKTPESGASALWFLLAGFPNAMNVHGCSSKAFLVLGNRTSRVGVLEFPQSVGEGYLAAISFQNYFNY